MGYKRVLKYLSVLAIIVFLIDLSLLCQPDAELTCTGRWSESIGYPLGIFSIALFFLSLILRFTREQVFRSWLKFARIFLPIAIALIVLTPSGSGGFSAGFGGPDRETVTEELAALFSLISLVLIVYKSIKLRSRKSADNSRTIS